MAAHLCPLVPPFFFPLPYGELPYIMRSQYGSTKPPG
jgi:hypothetical protein